MGNKNQPNLEHTIGQSSMVFPFNWPDLTSGYPYKINPYEGN